MGSRAGRGALPGSLPSGGVHPSSFKAGHKVEFDYIIIGAGAAGCVLADRLSADGGSSVLLLEAGRHDRHPYIRIPAGFFYLLSDPRFNWGYSSAPEPGLDGRRMPYPRGKVVGGSGSINGLWQSRGLPVDYDRWAEQGCTGWSFADIKPYFDRSEAFAPELGTGRGHAGPIKVDMSQVHPLTARFLEGGPSLQLPIIKDYNSSPGEGLAVVQQTRRGRFRETSATAYLKPALRRPNLDLVTRAHVTGIDIRDGRAVGVRFRREGRSQEENAVARAEIVLSAGSINSPHLLHLSGIGPAQELADAGIHPVVDLPGVGKNLQDHIVARIVYELPGTATLNQTSRGLRLLGQILRYVLAGDGILTYSAANGTGFLKSRPELPDPDLQLVFTPASYSPEKAGRLDRSSAISLGVWQMRPESRGVLRTVSPDPSIAPEFTLGYLTDERDQRSMVAGLKLCRRLLDAAFSGQRTNELRPGADVTSDEALLAHIRRTGTTTFHPVGSCRMGLDDGAVVTPELKVRGVRGLRVVDGSVMPNVTSSNTFAPIVAIAEKAADLIIADRKASTRGAKGTVSASSEEK